MGASRLLDPSQLAVARDVGGTGTLLGGLDDDRGRSSVAREGGVHHFYRLLADRFAAGGEGG